MHQPMRGITPAQMRKLWHAGKQCGLNDSGLHQVVAEVTGKGSIKALSCEEGARVIDLLVARGADATQSPHPKRERGGPLPDNVVRLMTDKQVDMISRLLWHLGWKADDELFRGCVRRAIGRENIRTVKEAGKIIEMLKAKIRDLGLETQVVPSHRADWGGQSGCRGVN